MGTRYVHYVFQVRSQFSFRAFALLSVLVRHRRHNDSLWCDSGAYETARLHDIQVALVFTFLREDFVKVVSTRSSTCCLRRGRGTTWVSCASGVFTTSPAAVSCT